MSTTTTTTTTTTASMWPWASTTSREWFVHKFGGTSLATTDCYSIVANILNEPSKRHKQQQQQQPCSTSLSSSTSSSAISTIITKSTTASMARQAIVVSAMAGVTNELLEIVDMAKNGDIEYVSTFNNLVRKHIDAYHVLTTTTTTTNEISYNGIDNTLQRFDADSKNILDLLRAIFLTKTCSIFYRDLIVGHGELWSAQLLCAHLRACHHVRAGWLDARQVLVVDGDRESMESPMVAWEQSKAKFAEWYQYKGNEYDAVVITGFIAGDLNGTPTTLKRNGSDYSASIFGNILQAIDITIWTDVDGVYSADPRRVPTAYLLHSMSYTEAIEFSSYGAKILHPKTMAPAMLNDIPIRIRNTFNLTSAGTTIRNRRDVNMSGPSGVTVSGMSTPSSLRDSFHDSFTDICSTVDLSSGCNEKAVVTGLCIRDKLCLINVSNVHVNRNSDGNVGRGSSNTSDEYTPLHIRSRLLSSLRNVNVAMVTIAQAAPTHSLCICVPEESAETARTAIQQHFVNSITGSRPVIEVLHGYSVVTAVGDTVNQIAGVSGKFFGALSRVNINVLGIAQNGERIISVLIESSHGTCAMQALHTEFLMPSKRINVGIIGPGLVGAELLYQLACRLSSEVDTSKKECIQFRVSAVANSRYMALQSNDSLKNDDLAVTWRERLSDLLDLEKMANHLMDGSSGYAIMVDCTSNDSIAALYPSWLRKGIHIVTPNKKAFSGPLPLWQEIRALTAPGRLHVYHEATVGAGLPVISTLQTLLNTGDNILRIEGVFSGTLSFILNTFCQETERKFSDIVAEAQRKGFTEPNPKDDLEGMDVARKVCILGRVAGLNINLDDISVESLVPAALADIMDGVQFLEKLKDFDDSFDQQRRMAITSGKVLRFVGVIDNTGPTQVFVEMRSYDSGHAFSSLRGSDNVIAFTTDRYPSPLVVQGAGAGAAVTAAGVVGDMISLSRVILRRPGPSIPAKYMK